MTKCPWVMGHGNAVQGIVRPMTHGGNIHCTIHDPWGTNFPWVMGCTEGVGGWLSMDHGLYGGTFTPWVMDRTVICLPHGSWAIRWYIYPMGDGSYGSTYTPWIMDCTVVHIPHGSWVVRWSIHPMGHGLYRGTVTPWVMGCMAIPLPHGSWAVRWYIHPMGDGSYRGTATPWVMGRAEGVGGLLPMDHGSYGGTLPHG